MTCPSCSAENPDDSKFCNECGTKLETTPVREERKVITALFCDLVGSTALGERLDAEDISRLLRCYQETCRARIESHGGVVEKFIGDAVVGVFGVPLAHEDDPERAVRAALRIIEDIAASDLGIEVRIGVNTGEALVRLDVDPRSGQGFATGDTMNTAARLEAAAPVMGVAVGAGTFKASAEAIVFEELAPISAKGKAEPVAAWRALRPTARIGTEERDRTPFVGRDLELSMLTQLFDRSRSRPSTEFVTIIAEPGLGKSRLVRELARHVDALPEFVTWREGRCLPYGDGISFWALGEIVKAQAGILETDDQDTLSSKLDQAITDPDPQTLAWIKDRLAPLVGLETSTEPPQRDEAFTAWRGFLEQIAGSGPTVLVVEDLHWADAAFVAFLEHLAERTAGLPLLVIVTARPELEERHPSWPPGRRSTVLSLSPLADDDIGTLITQSLPDTDPELLFIVLERAGGSPLYAEQLAAMLRERALPIAGGALDETMIPSSVQALIAARIDALPPEPKRVLMEASVVGKTFWSGAISVLGEHDDLDATLGELVRREFCRPVHPSTMAGDAEFGFWHALVRDVAYAELTKAERARMHADTARWIADRTSGAMVEDAEIVVHHLDAALELAHSAPGLDPEPLTELLTDALIAAGDAAMRTDIPRTIPLLLRILSIIPIEDGRALKASRHLAEAFAATGERDPARSLYEELLARYFDVNESEEAVDVAGDLFRLLQSFGEVDAGSVLISDLRGRLAPAPSAALVRLMVLEAEEFGVFGREMESLERARSAILMADDLGLPPPTEALVASAISRMALGDLEALTEARIAVDEFLREGRALDALEAMFDVAACATNWSPTIAVGLLDESIELATRIGADVYVWRMKAAKAETHVSLGQLEEVEAEVESILEWSTEASESFARLVALRCLAKVELFRRGTRVDVEELAELHRSVFGARSVGLAGQLAHARGDDDTARALLKEAVGNSGGAKDYLIPVCIETGLVTQAEELLAEDLPQGEFARADRAAAAGAMAGSRGDWAEASDRYREAAQSWAALDQILRHAMAVDDLGRALLEAGEADESLTCLREARGLWDGMGATRRVVEIDQLLETISTSDGSSA